MLRFAVTSFIVLLNFLLQTTLFNNIAFLGIRPNTMIIIIVSFAIFRGDVEAAILGFFSGLLQDLYYNRMIGLFAVLGMLTGYICGKPFKDYFSENYFPPLVMVGVITPLYEFFIYFFNFLFRGRIDLLFYIRDFILPATIYTLLMTLPVYRLMYAVNGRLQRYENNRRRLFE